MPKKQKENLDVGYFRSRNLSVCSLFNLDKHDAALLFAHMEMVDEEFTGNVNIEKFASKFLPEEKYVFGFLWNYFVIIFQDSRLGLGSGAYIDNITMAKLDVENTEVIKDKEHGTYVEVTAFLFFLVSIHKKHFSHFLYWLIYMVNNETKSRKGLINMVDTMWKLDKAYIDKKKAKKRTLLMSEVKKAIKHLEPNALDIKTFQIYDFRVQTAFSIPVQNLQNEIIKKIANKLFWKKGKEELNLILNDPSRIVPRMGEKNSAEKHSYRSIGDRKYAWFELRDFIEEFFRFHETANSIVMEPVTLFQKLKKKLFPPKIKESTIVPVDIETSDAVTNFSLVKKVDTRTKWSVTKFYEEAENNREYALKMLEETEEELAEPIPDIWDNEGDGVRMKRSSNQDGSDDESDMSNEFIDNQYSDDSD